jgi:hypothetical protein
MVITAKRPLPAALAARPQPPVLSVPCGAGHLGHTLVGCSPGWVARGVRADARRRHQREQSGMGWAGAVGGKGRLIFLYPGVFCASSTKAERCMTYGQR